MDKFQREIRNIIFMSTFDELQASGYIAEATLLEMSHNITYHILRSLEQKHITFVREECND